MLAAGAVLLAALGQPPGEALYVYFAQPFVELFWYVVRPDERAMWIYTPSEVVVKAVPLTLIGAGLAVCFRANVWNIGAAGQYTLGRDRGGAAGARTRRTAPGWLWLPLYLVAGRLWRDGLGGDPGTAQDPLQCERDPGQPDADLCRGAAARLAGARAVEGPGRLRLPANRASSRAPT